MSRRRMYTLDRRIAEIAGSQGADYVVHVECVKPSYTSTEYRICGNIDLPPLISSYRPALFRPSRSGPTHQYTRQDSPRMYTPWGLYPHGYRVYVSWGPTLAYCDSMILGEGVVGLSCPGKPMDWLMTPLRRVARRMGYRLAVAERRLYSMEAVDRSAEIVYRRLEKRGVGPLLHLHMVGMPHLAVAVARRLVEVYGVPLDEVARLLEIHYDPDEGSGERNAVKIYVDYMCREGDTVACYASRMLHMPVWGELARYARSPRTTHTPARLHSIRA